MKQERMEHPDAMSCPRIGTHNIGQFLISDMILAKPASCDRMILDNGRKGDIIFSFGGGRMSNRPSTADIAAFLADVKNLVSSGKYDFVPRRKNMQALARHGITIEDAKDEILGLVADDYYGGPKQDHDPGRPGDIWEFKKSIGEIRFYVKVKIALQGGENILKCLSFHEDDFA